MNECEKHRKKKNIHKWEWKKRKGWSSQRFAQPGSSSCPPALLTAPNTHTSQAKTHNPVSPLSHTARHITNPFTCTSTHSSLLYLAWSVNGKALSLHVGRHFLFVCLESMPAALNLISWRKKRKKGKWKVRVMRREADLWEWLADVLAWFQPMRGSGVSPSPFNCKSQWLSAIG